MGLYVHMHTHTCKHEYTHMYTIHTHTYMKRRKQINVERGRGGCLLRTGAAAQLAECEPSMHDSQHLLGVGGVTSVIPAVRRKRKKDRRIKVSLGYIMNLGLAWAM